MQAFKKDMTVPSYQHEHIHAIYSWLNESSCDIYCCSALMFLCSEARVETALMSFNTHLLLTP